METLTKDELVSCASAIMDKSEVDESLLALGTSCSAWRRRCLKRQSRLRWR